MRRTIGFTLIELATTLAVIAICAGVALPSMLEFLEYQRTSAVTGTLLANMALARTAAVSFNRAAVLCPSTDSTTCADGTDWTPGWILFLDDNGNRQVDAGEEIIRVEQEPTSRKLVVKATAGRPQLRYLPDGRAAGTNLTISICNHERLLGSVIVNNMGRPRSERPSTPTSCPAG